MHLGSYLQEFGKTKIYLPIQDDAAQLSKEVRHHISEAAALLIKLTTRVFKSCEGGL